MPRGGGDWTEKKTARLIHLWNVEKKTASQIAEELNCTRSAITGKVKRTPQCEKRGSPLKPAGSGKRPRRKAKPDGPRIDRAAQSRLYFEQSLEEQRQQSRELKR